MEIVEKTNIHMVKKIVKKIDSAEEIQTAKNIYRQWKKYRLWKKKQIQLKTVKKKYIGQKYKDSSTKK